MSYTDKPSNLFNDNNCKYDLDNKVSFGGFPSTPVDNPFKRRLLNDIDSLQKLKYPDDFEIKKYHVFQSWNTEFANPTLDIQTALDYAADELSIGYNKIFIRKSVIQYLYECKSLIDFVNKTWVRYVKENLSCLSDDLVINTLCHSFNIIVEFVEDSMFINGVDAFLVSTKDTEISPMPLVLLFKND